MRRWPSERWGQVALVLAAVALLVAAGLYYKSTKTFTRQEVTDQIQQSRIILSRQSCRQRNSERAVQRANLRDNLRNLAQIPDASLEALGFTREEAEAQIRKQLRQVAPLDCGKLVRQVSSQHITKPTTRRGGGSESSGAPRPQATKRAPERKTGGGGGSRPSQPERPSQPGTGPQQPPVGGGPPSGRPSPPGGGNGGPVTPPGKPPIKPPVNPPQNPGGLVQEIVDGAGHVVDGLLPP